MAKRLRFRVGDRVTVPAGAFYGACGRITQRAHEQVRDYLDWVVTFDEPVHAHGHLHEWSGFGDDELEPWTAPAEARPFSSGVLRW